VTVPLTIPAETKQPFLTIKPFHEMSRMGASVLRLHLGPQHRVSPLLQHLSNLTPLPQFKWLQTSRPVALFNRSRSLTNCYVFNQKEGSNYHAHEMASTVPLDAFLNHRFWDLMLQPPRLFFLFQNPNLDRYHQHRRPFRNLPFHENVACNFA